MAAMMSESDYGWEDATFFKTHGGYPLISEVPPCSRVPVAAFQQDKIWADGKGKTWDIHDIADGHIDNIIRWIKAHSMHWDHPVLVSPLMRALEEEVKKRRPTRTRTPRAALKDVVLNDLDAAFWPAKEMSPIRKVDGIVNLILTGLRVRGYDIVRRAE